MILERLSKITVVASACVAVLFGAWLGAREWHLLLPLSVAALMIGTVAGRQWPLWSWTAVLSVAYIFPALFLLTRGFMQPSYWVLWFAALIGAAVGNLDFQRWSYPERWKWPLAYWSLAVALVWPVVVAREANFSWDLMSRYHLASAGAGGGPPPVVAVWILSVALTHLAGALWFDAACGRFANQSPEARTALLMRTVVWPLGLSVFLGSLVAIYQGVVDINWMSGHQWPVFQRAAGSLDDGNAFGAAAGLWVGAFLAAGAASQRRLVHVISVVGACAAGAGLWMTGSRMALLLAMICLAFALWGALSARKWSRRDLGFAGLSLVGTALLIGLLAMRSSTWSPVSRISESLPTAFTSEHLRTFAAFELWNRFGPYGTASMRMVREFPIAGIGIGSFNHLFTDYSFILTGARAHSDNAQSWYRHQLAELGVVGSLGWLIWVPMVVGMLIRSRGDSTNRFAATMVKGALVGVGIVSIVSMPTQSVPVAFTVWVLVFWYLQLSSGAMLAASAPAFPRRSLLPALTWLLTIVVVGTTAWTGWRQLRPPYRAVRADWTYQVGFSELESSSGRPAFRWTEKHAVITVRVTGPWLRLTFRPSAQSGLPPQSLAVRRAGKLIGSALLTNAEPTTWYVRTPAGPRMMLEFDVSHTSRRPDGNDVGVAVDDWVFVDEPPRGSVEIR